MDKLLLLEALDCLICTAEYATSHDSIYNDEKKTSVSFETAYELRNELSSEIEAEGIYYG